MGNLLKVSYKFSKRTEIKKDVECCNICYSEIKNKRNCKTCTFKSCKKCINKWFEKDNKCPMCKNEKSWKNVTYNKKEVMQQQLVPLTITRPRPRTLPIIHQQRNSNNRRRRYYRDVIFEPEPGVGPRFNPDIRRIRREQIPERRLLTVLDDINNDYINNDETFPRITINPGTRTQEANLQLQHPSIPSSYLAMSDYYSGELIIETRS